jgi:uncharacterized protein
MTSTRTSLRPAGAVLLALAMALALLPTLDPSTSATAQEADLCEVDAEALTPISAIQGPGEATPIAGETVVTRGVLTADFTSGGASGLPNNQGLRGFFLEAAAVDRDADPATSEGVFVFDAAGVVPGALGDLVYVEGVAGEFGDVTQVAAARHQVCADTGVDTTLPAPAVLPLPADPFVRGEVFEPLESMRVTHPELTVVEFFQLERFGEVRLSSGGVLANPTNVVDPDDDTAYEAIVAFNRANNIVLDDGRTGQNLNRLPLGEVDPLPYVEPGDTLRIGDQLRDHTTVLHFGFGEWRLQPVDIDAITQEFQENRTRPRPESPPEVGGTMTVASFNVLNYFDGDGQGGGFPNARGAVTPSEFERQTAKLVDAVSRLDADVVGLIEIENDGGETQATRTFVDALNDAYGTDVYDFVDTGVIGTDEIKVAFVYKPDTVEATGEHAILDSTVDPRFDDDLNRPVLAQTFTELATGQAVTVAVNHLKSKGSACAPEDNDPRQGNCNGVRLRAAEAMADWLATDPTGQPAIGSLIIGDLNAYAQEDPIRALQADGYTDLLDRFAADGVMPYTFTFDATQGYLDHALADEAVLPFVTGTAAWNINADEVPAIDYRESVGAPGNARFRTAEVAAAYYQPDAFRSSDHDPVLVGLDLGAARAPCDGTQGLVEFDDALGFWAAQIECMAAYGITAGFPDGTFRPGAAVTRQQMALFIARLAAQATGGDLAIPSSDEDAFDDIADINPPEARDAINWLAELGVTTGVSADRFVPGGRVTRQQMASFIARAHVALGVDLPDPSSPTVFTDTTLIAPVHRGNVLTLHAAGVVQGRTDGTYDPGGLVTRGQMSGFIVRSIGVLDDQGLWNGELVVPTAVPTGG